MPIEISVEESPVKQYTKPSNLDYFITLPKWFTFEGDLTKDKDLDIYVNELAQILVDAKKFIHGVAGEFCSRVWNHDTVINALQNSKAEDISFICGPKFDIKNLEFIKLVKNKKINLLLTTERQEEHFRVTDKGVIVEGHHKEFQPERRAIICKDSTITNFMYDLKFKELGQKLKAEGRLEQVEAKEILNKFKPRVYDQSDKANYRKPKKDEIGEFFKIVNGREPTESELDEILNKILYLFSWHKIPGSDDERLSEYIAENFGIEQLKQAKIEKIDDGRTIRVTSEDNIFSLRLNDEKNKVFLEIDDGRTEELIVRMENSKLNIYENN